MVRVSGDGRTAYLVNDEGWNFVAIDLGNLSRLRICSVSATGGFAHGLALRSHLAFVCNNRDACTIFDVSDPDYPRSVWSGRRVEPLPQGGGPGDTPYLDTADGILWVDIRDVSRPRVERRHSGHRQVLHGRVRRWESGGRRILAGALPTGWAALDVTDSGASAAGG